MIINFYRKFFLQDEKYMIEYKKKILYKKRRKIREKMIRNDKDNELTKTITNMAKESIQRGNVFGIYINSFTEEQQQKIDIVSVVDEVTENWESQYDRNFNPRIVVPNVHNIRIMQSVITESQFPWVYMEYQEAILAQELKNSYIIYNGCSEEEGEKTLEDYQKFYLQDDQLTIYKNRLEISPQIIKKIRQGI